MHGYENNYNVMQWYIENWNAQITHAQSATNEGRYYTNHFAIAVSTYCVYVLNGLKLTIFFLI